jgi:hypothetical protein
VWATCSTAAIQNSDFWFHDDGDTIFIDGKRGAPLHIDYIGAPLTQPLTVRVTPNNPKLKIAAPTCTFTKKDDDCRLTVQLKNQSEKVYGVNQFTLTEVGGSRGVLNAQAASDTNTVGFGVGVQGKDMPKPIRVKVSRSSWRSTGFAIRGPGKAVIVNATREARSYRIKGIRVNPTIDEDGDFRPSLDFVLPTKTLCYGDWDVFNDPQKNDVIYDIQFKTSGGGVIYDITNPYESIFNGVSASEAEYILSCSAVGIKSCSSNKWGSWTVGLANFGATDMDGGVRAGQIEILRDNSWWSLGSIYYKVGVDDGLALLQIQGSTDGSENWDVKAATPSILDIKSAPPCSNYLKGDPSVTYKVIADVYGPGSVTMSGGKQCVIVKVPKSEFTRCTGSGIKDRIYEITAVPEAGKTFKGWNSKGLCDDAKTTCRFQLTSEVSIQPLFW